MDLKPGSRRLAFFVAYIIIAGGLWTASSWWERGLATRLGEPSISPNGCYRVEAFKPFWVLPNTFHRRPDFNEVRPPEWFPWWGYPAFLRLYDHRNGELISETEIFDSESAGGQLDWGNGSNHMSAGMITMSLNLPDCRGDVPHSKRSQP